MKVAVWNPVALTIPPPDGPLRLSSNTKKEQGQQCATQVMAYSTVEQRAYLRLADHLLHLSFWSPKDLARTRRRHLKVYKWKFTDQQHVQHHIKSVRSHLTKTKWEREKWSDCHSRGPTEGPWPNCTEPSWHWGLNLMPLPRSPSPSQSAKSFLLWSIPTRFYIIYPTPHNFLVASFFILGWVVAPWEQDGESSFVLTFCPGATSV